MSDSLPKRGLTPCTKGDAMNEKYKSGFVTLIGRPNESSDRAEDRDHIE